MIYSDKAGCVIGMGQHYAIQIGDFVYDKLTEHGMLIDDWLKDLGIGKYAGIWYDYVHQIDTVTWS